MNDNHSIKRPEKEGARGGNKKRKGDPRPKIWVEKKGNGAGGGQPKRREESVRDAAWYTEKNAKLTFLLNEGSISEPRKRELSAQYETNLYELHKLKQRNAMVQEPRMPDKQPELPPPAVARSVEPSAKTAARKDKGGPRKQGTRAATRKSAVEKSLINSEAKAKGIDDARQDRVEFARQDVQSANAILDNLLQQQAAPKPEEEDEDTSEEEESVEPKAPETTADKWLSDLYRCDWLGPHSKFTFWEGRAYHLTTIAARLILATLLWLVLCSFICNSLQGIAYTYLSAHDADLTRAKALECFVGKYDQGRSYWTLGGGLTKLDVKPGDPYYDHFYDSSGSAIKGAKNIPTQRIMESIRKLRQSSANALTAYNWISNLSTFLYQGKYLTGEAFFFIILFFLWGKIYHSDTVKHSYHNVEYFDPKTWRACDKDAPGAVTADYFNTARDMRNDVSARSKKEHEPLYFAYTRHEEHWWYIGVGRMKVPVFRHIKKVPNVKLSSMELVFQICHPFNMEWTAPEDICIDRMTKTKNTTQSININKQLIITKQDVFENSRAISLGFFYGLRQDHSKSAFQLAPELKAAYQFDFLHTDTVDTRCLYLMTQISGLARAYRSYVHMGQTLVSLCLFLWAYM
ncbi:hypothetical protein 1 [Hubei tombus-like virus 36]|uniref:hypothetical protein 1 n=1 Tax=Hubei tombus-like virus 36 TaxID=1923284 RepID=UPI00090BB677|nr:hypothetical protein 1 [Hubei tombus-like virus 36]APG76456.1 hypothetical protein 1 [Hubei tombus-like virus 36]